LCPTRIRVIDMLQFIDLTRVRETETLSKNEASLKSHTSKGNFLRKTCFAVWAVGIVLLLSSCAKIYYSVDGKTIAQKHHRSVAIMPSFVSISRTGAHRKVALEVLERQEAVESLNFQQAIHTWMQKSKSEGKVTVEIQDIKETNEKLKSAGYPETLITDAKLCEILGVDGVILSNFELSKPFSTGEAIAIGFAMSNMAGYPMWLSTDEVRGAIAINDCANQKIIWSYQHNLEGDNPQTIVAKFMKKAGKKMPYVK